MFWVRVRCVKNEVLITLELMHFGSLEDVVRSRGSMRFAPRAAMCAARCVANGWRIYTTLSRSYIAT